MSRPFIKANGGSPGVKASVSAASSVTLTLDSLIGVVTVAWSVLTTDETTSVNDYTLVVSGSRGQTCTFDALTAGTAVIVKVTINGGLVRDRVDLLNTTNTIKVFVPTAEGFEVGCAGETFESDSTVGTTGILNQPIRQLNTFTTSLYTSDLKRALASKDTNVALTGNPSPMDGQTIATGDVVLLVGQTAPAENGLWKVNTAGAWTRPDNFATQAAIEGCTAVVIRGNARAGYIYQNTNTGSIVVGTTALTFQRLPDKYDRADLGNASSTPAGNILAKFGASSQLLASYFSSNGSNPAQVGILRGLYNSVLVAARNAANASDLHALSMVGTDIVQIGSSLVEGVRLSAKATGLVEFLDNTVAFLTASKASGLVFGTASSMNLTQSAASGGAGANASFVAQTGDTGFDGGNMTISSGTPGTGGNPGNVTLQCNAGATSSGQVAFRGGGFGTFAAFSYDNSATETVVACGPDDARIDTKVLRLDSTQIGMFAPSAAGSFGSGLNVVWIGNADTDPTTDITDGSGIYASNTSLRARNHALAVLAPRVEGAPGNEDLRTKDWRVQRLQTTDATPTTAYSFALPTSSSAHFEVIVDAYTPADGTSATYKVEGGGKRFGGAGAALIGAPVTASWEDNASMNAVLDVSGNNVIVVVTGLAATTIEWMVTTNATLMQPAP